jgi:hypothetical protein
VREESTMTEKLEELMDVTDTLPPPPASESN